MLSYLKGYAEYQHIVRGLGKGTVSTYTTDLKQFHGWLQDTGRATHPDGITAGDIKDFMSALIFKYKNLKNSTRAQKRSALKSFFDYMITEGLLVLNPVAEVPSPKIAKLMPVKFTTKELALLFYESSRNPEDIWELRDHAILKVMYAAGLRVSELSGLSLEDLNDSGRHVRLQIMGKGSHQRVITLRANPAAALRRWITIRLGLETKHTALFISTRHRNRLDAEGINDVLKKYGARVGIKKADAFVHKMRATCFADLYDSGTDYCTHCGQRVNVIDIYFIAAFAGHSSIETMKSYINISDKVQKRGIPDRRFSDIDRLAEKLTRGGHDG